MSFIPSILSFLFALLGIIVIFDQCLSVSLAHVPFHPHPISLDFFVFNVFRCAKAPVQLAVSVGWSVGNANVRQITQCTYLAYLALFFHDRISSFALSVSLYARTSSRCLSFFFILPLFYGNLYRYFIPYHLIGQVHAGDIIKYSQKQPSR